MTEQGYQITVELTPESMAFFESERKRLYPGHANSMSAHLTLIYFIQFISEIQITDLAILLPRSFEISVNRILQLKKGVAYGVDAATLFSLHQAIVSKFPGEVSRRDTQDYIPHITVCNKVTTYKAQRIYNELKESFKPFIVRALGVTLKHKDRESIFLPFDV